VPQPLASARRLGLSDAWLKKLEIASPNLRQVLSIVRLVGGSPAVGRLKQGDMLLAIDEKVVTRFREVELAVADKPQVNVTVWRDGEEKTVPLATAAHRQCIDRIVMWAGATFRLPPRDDRSAGYPSRRRHIPTSPTVRRRHVMVFIPGRRIVEVDGVRPRIWTHFSRWCRGGRTGPRSGCVPSPGITHRK
jgi:hypothetical protein